MGTFTKGIIGEEDVQFKASGTTLQTFTRSDASGRTLTLEQIDGAHIQFRTVAKSIDDLIDGGYDVAIKPQYIFGGASNTNGHTVPNVADDTFVMQSNTETIDGVKTFSGNNTHSGTNAFSGVVTFTGTRKGDKGANVASEAQLFSAAFPTDGNYFDVTGNTGITSIKTSGQVGTVIKLHFDAILTITHHATNLILPGATDIETYAGLELEFTEYSSADWRLTGGSIMPHDHSAGALGGTLADATSIRSSYRNLLIVPGGTPDEQLTITIDEIILQNASSETYRASSVSLTADNTDSGVNGIDTGSVTGTTWYHVWIISNGTTTASLLSLQSTDNATFKSNLPSGYTFYGYVHSVYTDATSDFIPVTLNNNRVVMAVQATPVTAASNDPGAGAAADLSAQVPTTARHVFGYLNIQCGNTETAGFRIGSNSSFHGERIYEWDNRSGGTGAIDFAWEQPIIASEAQKIYYVRKTASEGVLAIYVTGWGY